MPKNKYFQLRIEILDELLSSIRKKTFEDLLASLNEKLIDSGVSPIKKRTLFNDLDYLEAHLSAPIHRPTKGDPSYYYLQKFSVKNLPLGEEEVSYLRQAINMLRRATDLRVTGEVEEVIRRLENKVHITSLADKPIVVFEQHTQALGVEYLNDLYTAIQSKCALKIEYVPFRQGAKQWIVHPYLLKEFRNRWFLIARKGTEAFILDLALDRIAKISNCADAFVENDLFNPETYFNHLIGVTRFEGSMIEKIILSVKPESAEYIRTKPIHHLSQQVLKVYENGSIEIQLQVIINPELKSILLGYGPAVEVLSPPHLRVEIKELLASSIKLYQ